MASKRAPTLAELRREARRVYGRDAATHINAWSADASTNDGRLGICVDAMTHGDAKSALMAALRALPDAGKAGK